MRSGRLESSRRSQAWTCLLGMVTRETSILYSPVVRTLRRKPDAPLGTQTICVTASRQAGAAYVGNEKIIGRHPKDLWNMSVVFSKANGFPDSWYGKDQVHSGGWLGYYVSGWWRPEKRNAEQDCKQRPVLHVADACTKFQSATFLPFLDATTISNTFVKMWSAMYISFPESMLTDQGSVFVSKKWEYNCELAII